jgi:RimJ/RimL family protein N-acetyltransferase
MPFTHFEISGNKIRLRPIRIEDAEIRYRLHQDKAVLTYLATRGYTNVAEVSGRLQEAVNEWQTGQSYMCAIERLNEPGFIGNISIRFRLHPQQADIGYWVGQEFWNKGYVTEAVRLACHVCFKHLKSNKVYATVFVGNDASRRVLEKNGFFPRRHGEAVLLYTGQLERRLVFQPAQRRVGAAHRVLPSFV